jgi:histidinol-phosphate aminotransferase
LNLRNAIAKRFNLDANRLMFGAGSDDLILLLLHAFVQPDDEIIASQYAFSMYAVAARAVGAKAVMVPEKDLQPDLDAMLKAVTPRTRIVFIANPNNPTGSWLTRTQINQFLRELPQDIMFVYDAAYVDYMDDADYSDGFEWAEEDGRVCVLRTFSKVHGLGGMRIGYAYGPSVVIENINRIRNPFNVSVAGEAAAIASVNDESFLTMNREHNLVWREKLFNELLLIAKPYPSKANFILTRFASKEQATAMFNHLKANSILVRPMAGYGLPDCLRFTVGQAHEMAALFAVLNTFKG